MLYNISDGTQRIAHNVIRNHPNTWSVQFMRKVLERTQPDVIGGIGMLDSADEQAYHFEFLSNGYALRAEPHQGAGLNMTERRDAPIGSAEDFVYMLAPELPDVVLGAPPPEPVELKTKDVVLFFLGDGAGAARLAFEVASIEPMMAMPPYLPRYVLQRRAELDMQATQPPSGP